MIQFNDIQLDTFLTDYWQKKPLLIRNALPEFNSPISAEELAGLSLESEIESRIVVEHADNNFELIKGPFTESQYSKLPEKNWTLLVQGVDRIIPEVNALLDEFNFIPSWRIDDIMISYATEGGNVGPHFDHYDVFLLQAKGQRKWQLTAKNCNLDNYIQGIDLRLMKQFEVEDEYICQPGDLLYIPPKWGHHGVGLTDDCMTYSIGYRSYKGLELWDSFGDYLAESGLFQELYHDPNWQNVQPGEISTASWQQAQRLLQNALLDENAIKHWFGRFATQLDQTASQMLPEPLTESETNDIETLVSVLDEAKAILRDPICRFAFTEFNETVKLYINSTEWETFNAETGFIKTLCNQRLMTQPDLKKALRHKGNQALLHELWRQQFFEIINK